MRIPARVACIAALLLAASMTRAESLLPPEPVPLDSLVGFRPTRGNWAVAGGLAGDPRHDKVLAAAPGTGVLVNNPRAGAPNDGLVTAWEHGDLDVDLDFLIPPGANSGVYLQGRYEVQILDSAGVKVPLFSDCGGIYQRWDESRGPGRSGYEGHAPKANASRAPGLWQHLHIEFRAPRFDAKGAKIAHARFVKVVLNGYVVQENVEVTGPTRASPFADEKPTGPLLVQGDHGAIALRHLAVKRYGAAAPAVQDLQLKYYAGAEFDFENYAAAKPTRTGALEHFTDAVTLADDRGVVLVTGTFVAPVAGDYEFRPVVAGPARLFVDGQLAVGQGVASPQVGVVTLTAGAHPFKLEYQHQGSWAVRAGGLRLWVEGPGIAPQSLRPAVQSDAPARTVTIPIETKDRVLLQRTFVTLENSRRMYACIVGSPTGVNYAYDIESAALIGVWKGGFFEGRDLWHERAEDQEAHPAGPGFSIEGRPLLFQFGDHDAHWPDRPPGTSATMGYRLEADGQPVFKFSFSGVVAEDRIAARADGAGLTRTLKFSGKPRERDMWALLAESSAITAAPDGAGYLIGDREYYLDWPKDSPVQPLLRREGDRVQLLVKVPVTGVRELTYNLLW